MNLLTVSNLEKDFGAETLFSDIAFQVNEGEKIGLIGANGCGKTTLFRLLTGEMRPDEGNIHYAKIAKIGYMEQHVSNDETRNAYDAVLDVFSYLEEIEKELESVSKELEDKSGESAELLETLIKRQHNLQESFEKEGGYTYRSRARAALMGLGFSDAMMDQSVATLSGGEKAKVSLARLLLSQSNLLLLDEPTNHLDMKSVSWLEDFLRSYSGAAIIISHDRYFLDRVTSRTFEIEHGKLMAYDGNYSSFKKKKAAERENMQRHYDNTQKEIKRLEGIVEQQRRWNRERNIRMAESKLKQIARLEKDLEKPENEAKKLRFSFAEIPPSAQDVLHAEDLSKRFDGELLFEKVSFDLYSEERAFLIGSNGSGKSTLLKIITGKILPDSGFVQFGSGVSVGYYDQTHSHLASEKSILDEMSDSFPAMAQGQIRNALAAFLFVSDEVFKPINLLSGGEKARVALLKLMLSRANFLLLDEPTNHLDIQSREALESALLEYGGTLLVVSHDRYFINKLASRVLSIEGSQVIASVGNYDDYLEYLDRLNDVPQTGPAQAEKTAPAKEASGKDYYKDKEQRKKLRLLEGKVKRCEEALAENETQITDLEEMLAQPEIACDYQKAAELGEKLNELRAQGEQLLDDWMRFDEELSQLTESLEDQS